MTIDEAIKHAEEVAEQNEEISLYTPVEYIPADLSIEQCQNCAKEHRQLAEWLKELKKYREWLKSFNPDSATECFTAVRELRRFVGGDINIPTMARAEGSEG